SLRFWGRSQPETADRMRGPGSMSAGVPDTTRSARCWSFGRLDCDDFFDRLELGPSGTALPPRDRGLQSAEGVGRVPRFWILALCRDRDNALYDDVCLMPMWDGECARRSATLIFSFHLP